MSTSDLEDARAQSARFWPDHSHLAGVCRLSGHVGDILVKLDMLDVPHV